jgi:hypothetical protein
MALLALVCWNTSQARAEGDAPAADPAVAAPTDAAEAATAGTEAATDSSPAVRATEREPDEPGQTEDGEDAGEAGAPETPGCTPEPVSLRRLGRPGSVTVSLTDCDGRPNPEAVQAVRELARPQVDATASGAPDALLAPELLERLQRIADRFPGHAIEIVSGYRPRARPGSRHHSGDALDLRVDGVDNAELSAFARTLPATGVGYYPNSTFVHVDARAASFYWVDRSRPGERPQYAANADDSAASDAASAEPSTAELQSLSERALVVIELALARESGRQLSPRDAP